MIDHFEELMAAHSRIEELESELKEAYRHIIYLHEKLIALGSIDSIVLTRIAKVLDQFPAGKP